MQDNISNLLHETESAQEFIERVSKRKDPDLRSPEQDETILIWFKKVGERVITACYSEAVLDEEAKNDQEKGTWWHGEIMKNDFFKMRWADVDLPSNDWDNFENDKESYADKFDMVLQNIRTRSSKTRLLDYLTNVTFIQKQESATTNSESRANQRALQETQDSPVPESELTRTPSTSQELQHNALTIGHLLGISYRLVEKMGLALVGKPVLKSEDRYFFHGFDVSGHDESLALKYAKEDDQWQFAILTEADRRTYLMYALQEHGQDDVVEAGLWVLQINAAWRKMTKEELALLIRVFDSRQ